MPDPLYGHRQCYVTLQQKVDMRKIKSVLDEMEWSGWLIVERSRDKNEPTDVRKISVLISII